MTRQNLDLTLRLLEHTWQQDDQNRFFNLRVGSLTNRGSLILFGLLCCFAIKMRWLSVRSEAPSPNMVLSPILENNQACWDPYRAGSDAVGTPLAVITTVVVNISWLHRKMLQCHFSQNKFDVWCCGIINFIQMSNINIVPEAQTLSSWKGGKTIFLDICQTRTVSIITLGCTGTLNFI